MKAYALLWGWLQSMCSLRPKSVFNPLPRMYLRGMQKAATDMNWPHPDWKFSSSTCPWCWINQRCSWTTASVPVKAAQSSSVFISVFISAPRDLLGLLGKCFYSQYMLCISEAVLIHMYCLWTQCSCGVSERHFTSTVLCITHICKKHGVWWHRISRKEAFVNKKAVLVFVTSYLCACCSLLTEHFLTSDYIM